MRNICPSDPMRSNIDSADRLCFVLFPLCVRPKVVHTTRTIFSARNAYAYYALSARSWKSLWVPRTQSFGILGRSWSASCFWEQDLGDSWRDVVELVYCLRISIVRETGFGSLLPPVSFRNIVFAWDFLETLRKVETLGVGEPWKWETCWNHLKPKSFQIRAMLETTKKPNQMGMSQNWLPKDWAGWILPSPKYRIPLLKPWFSIGSIHCGLIIIALWGWNYPIIN